MTRYRRGGGSDSGRTLATVAAVLLLGRASRAEEQARGQTPVPPGVIRVVAADTTGAPVEGALLRVVQYSVAEQAYMGSHAGPGIETDSNGEASIAVDAPGRYRALLAEAPGIAKTWLWRGRWSESTETEIDLSAAEGSLLRLRVPRAGSLRVVVGRAGLSPDEHVSCEIQRRWPDGTLQSAGHSPEVNRTRGVTEDVHVFTGLPEGHYRISVLSVARESVEKEVDVAPRAEASVDVAPGARRDLDEWTYTGPVPADRRSLTFNVNPFSEGTIDLVHGSFKGTPLVARVRQLRPGRYLVILWDLDLAQVLDVPGRQPKSFHLEVPPEGVSSGGSAAVEVRLIHEGEWIRGVPGIAIAPAKGAEPSDGRWLRFTRNGKFAGVPAGEHDVIVFDRAFGNPLGVDPPVLYRRIRVKDGETLTVALDL